MAVCPPRVHKGFRRVLPFAGPLRACGASILGRAGEPQSMQALPARLLTTLHFLASKIVAGVTHGK